MADNFTVLKQQLDTAINPNAAPGQIYAQDHNDWDTAFMKMQGKYVGSPFIARRAFNGVANAGDLYWNGALNDTNGIEIITAKTTADLNDFGLILSRIGSGDLIHAKDYEGRSVFFEFKSYTEDVDNNNNVIYRIQVVPDGNNVNYYYQPTDEFICILEVVKSKSGSLNLFENLEVNLFWNGRGWNDEHDFSEYGKFIDRSKFVAKDGTGVYYFKTIKTKVYFLGIEVKNYDSIKDYNPVLVIERYKRPRQNQTNRALGDYHKSPAMYRSTWMFSDYIVANSPNMPNNSIYRPCLIPITERQKYYDIYAENYFSQVDPPKALGNQNFVTHPKTAEVGIQDDSETYSRKIPQRRKGFAHCRLRIRLDVTGKGDFIYSPVLTYFKIIDQLNWDYNTPPNESSVIKYSYE